MNTVNMMGSPDSTKKKTKRKCKISVPHLPEKFLEERTKERAIEGLTSTVFTSYMRQVRLDIAKSHSHGSLNPDSVVPPGMDATQDCTLLHFAAHKSDHLLVYEAIRLGVSIDRQDTKGQTALSLAIALWKDALMRGIPQKFRDHPDAFCDRMRQIVYALIDQHADVNRSFDGLSYLHQACRMGDFGLINKLLQHGAEAYPSQNAKNGTPSPSSFLPAGDLPRFRTLARRHIRGDRPARKCPCWSGKALVVCHGGMQETIYPSHFRCLCGSGRSYGQCSCSHRNNQIMERWHETEKRIVARFNRDVPFHPTLLYPDMYANSVDAGLLDAMGVLCFLMDVERPTTGECEERFAAYREEARELAVNLTFQGEVDVAYAYALSRSEFHPRPQGRSFDKRFLKMRQTAWNSLVDEYIALGTDQRPVIEIERAAKIGQSLGALHRVCENPACAKREGEDCQTLRTCSKCKMRVYCSRECQSAMWSEHKELCGKYYDREQMLESQLALLQACGPLAASSFMKKVVPCLDPNKKSPGRTQLQHMIDSLLSGKSPYKDFLDFADVCRTGLLNLKNYSVPLGNFHM